MREKEGLKEFRAGQRTNLWIRGPLPRCCARTHALVRDLAGVPSGLCKETAPNSGIFTRDYSKSTVQMDCGKWQGTITMK